MGGSSFDLIMQEVINQKQYLDKLVEENQNLQRQLAELRAGQGILLEVYGQQFTLNGEAVVATQAEKVSPKEGYSASQETINMPLNESIRLKTLQQLRHSRRSHLKLLTDLRHFYLRQSKTSTLLDTTQNSNLARLAASYRLSTPLKSLELHQDSQKLLFSCRGRAIHIVVLVSE